MKIKTTRFGEIDLNEENIINFSGSGILGFSSFKKFFILDIDEESPFRWLQSVENPDLAFIICDGKIFKKDYQVLLPKNELEDLELNSIDEAVIQVIVTVPSDPKKISGNLKAPLVINPLKRIAKQVILINSEYKIKHFLFDNF